MSAPVKDKKALVVLPPVRHYSLISGDEGGQLARALVYGASSVCLTALVIVGLVLGFGASEWAFLVVGVTFFVAISFNVLRGG